MYCSQTCLDKDQVEYVNKCPIRQERIDNGQEDQMASTPTNDKSGVPAHTLVHLSALEDEVNILIDHEEIIDKVKHQRKRMNQNR